MLSSNSSQTDDIRATVQLIRALLQKKSQILYEISLHTIKGNYYHSNLNVREARDLRIRTKLFLKRVKDIKNDMLFLKSARLKQIPTSLIHKTMSLFKKHKSILTGSFLKCSYFEIESQKNQSHDIYQQKTQVLKELSQKHERNEAKVHEIQKAKKKIMKTKLVIHDTHEKLSSLKDKIIELNTEKERNELRKLLTLGITQVFPSLSAKALDLRSKFLLKMELEQIFENTRREYDRRLSFLHAEKNKLLMIFDSDKLTVYGCSPKEDSYVFHKRIKSVQPPDSSLGSVNDDFSSCNTRSISPMFDSKSRNMSSIPMISLEELVDIQKNQTPKEAMLGENEQINKNFDRILLELKEWIHNNKMM